MKKQNNENLKNMKIKYTIVALALIAASCSSENILREEKVAKPFTITVSLPEEDNSTTRATYTRDESGMHKGIWNDGDALSVVFEIDGQYHAEKFELESKSEDSRKATFAAPATTKLPEKGSVTVGVYYPYRPANNPNYPGIPCFELNNSVNSDNLQGMGNYTLLYTTGIKITNRKIYPITFSNAGTSFIRLPKNLQIFTEHNETTTITREDLKINDFSLALYKPTELTLDNKGRIIVQSSTQIKNGILQSDVYLPFLIKEDYTSTADLDIWISGTRYSWTLPSRTVSSGKVYTVKQDKISPEVY